MVRSLWVNEGGSEKEERATSKLKKRDSHVLYIKESYYVPEEEWQKSLFNLFIGFKK